MQRKKCSVSHSKMLCNSAHLLIKFVTDLQIIYTSMIKMSSKLLIREKIIQQKFLNNFFPESTVEYRRDTGVPQFKATPGNSTMKSEPRMLIIE